MIAQMIATVGGIGYLRPAPGTWGSLAALPLTWALHQIGGFPLVLAAVLLALSALAVAVVRRVPCVRAVVIKRAKTRLTWL